MGRCWSQGAPPLWNPHIMTGLPFLADGEASVFHPLSLAFSLLRTDLAINWLVASAFVLTGLAFYGYLRALDLGRPAAWCGAVAWSFSTALVSRIFAGHLNILLTFISLPLIFMLWERYRARGRLAGLAGISAAYALMVLAWYPQLLYTFSLFFMCYVLVQSALAAITRVSTWRKEARAILALGAAVLLGVGVGAIQLLPALDFVAESFRQSATLEYCGRFSFPPENFLTLLAPQFFHTPQTLETTVYWGRNFFWEMWIYIGILPLLLAVAGAWVAPPRRRAALLACAAIFLVLGLGQNAPLFPAIYRTVPLFNVFRGSSKNMLVPLFCLVTLSAHGFEALFAQTDESRFRRARHAALAAGAAIFLAAALVLIVLLRGAEAPGSNWRAFVGWVQSSGECFEEFTGEISTDRVRATAAGAVRALGRGMLFCGLGMGLLLLAGSPPRRRLLFPAAAALVLADLLGIFLPMLRTFDRSLTELPLQWDRSVAPYTYPPRILNPGPFPNVAMKTGYSAIFGYTGNTLKRYNDAIGLIQGGDPSESQATAKFVQVTPQYKMLALDAVALDPGQVPAGGRPTGRLGQRVLVPYERFTPTVPRAYLAAAPRFFDRRQAALDYVFSATADVLTGPAIEAPDGGLAAQPLDPDETVRILSFTPQRVELETHASRPRALVLCEAFERNWIARVNGDPVPVAPANTLFRAVRVPAGPSRVVFEYRPAAFYRGAALTALSLAVLLAFSLFAAYRSRHNGGFANDPARS